MHSLVSISLAGGRQEFSCESLCPTILSCMYAFILTLGVWLIECGPQEGKRIALMRLQI